MNNEMAQRSNRRSQNPDSEAVLQDCITKWEESVAHSILARSTLTPLKAVNILRKPPCPSYFSLASRRRTIHSECAVIQLLSAFPIQMPLSVSEKFGPHEILAPIGNGGMAEAARSPIGPSNLLIKLEFDQKLGR